MKSIVMQTKGRQAVVLGNDGTFQKIANTGYHVGQELRTSRPLLRRASCVAAAAVLLLSGGTALAYYTPVSYASVDINPSVEFQLNLIGHVIGARGVNEDGKALLDNIKTGVNLGRNIQAVVREAAAEGYLKPDAENTVVVTIASNNEAQAQQDAEQAKEQAEEALEDAGAPGEVEVDRVGYNRVQEARKLGTTPGKLNLVQKYIASAGEGAQVDVNEWLGKPVKDIMKAIKANRKAAKAQKPAETATPAPSATASATESATPADTSTDPTATQTTEPTATPRNDGNNGKGNDDKEVNTKGNTGVGLLDSAKPEKTPKPENTPKPTKTPRPTKTPKPTNTDN